MRHLTQQEYESIQALETFPVHVQTEILEAVLKTGLDLVSAVSACLPVHSAAELGQGGN